MLPQSRRKCSTNRNGMRSRIPCKRASERARRDKRVRMVLSYRFEIYLCTNHYYFFSLDGFTCMPILPACLPACRFSHFLLFHLLFCLQQLIIPCFFLFGCFFSHSYSLIGFCSVCLHFGHRCILHRLCLDIKCNVCGRDQENSTQIQLKAVQRTTEKMLMLLFCIWMPLLLVRWFTIATVEKKKNRVFVRSLTQTHTHRQCNRSAYERPRFKMNEATIFKQKKTVKLS